MANILIVEDEEQMRLGLRDNLEFEDYKVDMAADGQEGLKKILDNSYDLILLYCLHMHIQDKLYQKHIKMSDT